jgi:[acyl-carrier-protein] S-malonyltransferase
VAAAVACCTEAGAKRAIELNVSGPFHCALMEPAVAPFGEALDAVALAMPRIPVVHNVDARVAVDLADLRAKLLAQIAQPVLWTRCIRQMIDSAVDGFVECGPGKVLNGLVKRIERSIPVHNIDSPEGLAAALAARPR